MYDASMLANLLLSMAAFNNGLPDLIQHYTKVHDYCRTIGTLEGLDEDTLFTLETASIVHDIAIAPCMRQLGRSDGKTQEEYGPGYARTLLASLDFPPAVIDRVCWLVGHHHTYDAIDSIDYRILVEADFLVNLFENNASKETILNAYDRIFRTKTGLQLCRSMFGLSENA